MLHLVACKIGLNFAPGTHFTLGDVHFGESPDLPQTTKPKVDVQLPCPGVVTNGQEVRIETNAWYWVEVTAKDGTAAQEYVRSEIDPIVQLVLSSAVQFPVTTQIANVQSKNDHGAWSSWSGGRFQPLNQQAEFDILSMVSLERAVKSNRKGRLVAKHLHRALQLESVSMSAGAVASEAALLEYAKAIELLAEDKRFRQDREAGDIAGRQRIVDDLAAALASDSSLSAKAEAIRSSRVSLDRLDEQFLGLKVKRMGEVLQLGDDWEDQASALLNLRNRKLAHPGQQLTEEEQASFRAPLSTGQAAFSRPEHLVRVALLAFLHTL